MCFWQCPQNNLSNTTVMMQICATKSEKHCVIWTDKGSLLLKFKTSKQAAMRHLSVLFLGFCGFFYRIIQWKKTNNARLRRKITDSTDSEPSFNSQCPWIYKSWLWNLGCILPYHTSPCFSFNLIRPIYLYTGKVILNDQRGWWNKETGWCFLKCISAFVTWFMEEI